jgi:hypothetical protein
MKCRALTSAGGMAHQREVTIAGYQHRDPNVHRATHAQQLLAVCGVSTVSPDFTGWREAETVTRNKRVLTRRAELNQAPTRPSYGSSGARGRPAKAFIAGYPLQVRSDDSTSGTIAPPGGHTRDENMDDEQKSPRQRGTRPGHLEIASQWGTGLHHPTR